MTQRITDIHINFVAQSMQRYPTLGDWTVASDGEGRTILHITITQMPDQRYSWPIAVHELVEALLCHTADITSADVDAWDITGPGRHLAEPGDDPQAPYHVQHMAAGDLEIQFAQQLGFTAAEYANYIDLVEDHDDDPK